MEGYGLIFLAMLVVGFAAGFAVSRLTRLRGLPAGAIGVGIVFVLTLALIEFVELAILVALLAALPTVAGVGLGARLSRNRGT